MSWALYQGAGDYRMLHWAKDGTLATEMARSTPVEPPNEAGDWVMVETVTTPAPDGVEREWRDTYTMAGGALTVRSEARPAGSSAPFALRVTLTYAKAE